MTGGSFFRTFLGSAKFNPLHDTYSQAASMLPEVKSVLFVNHKANIEVCGRPGADCLPWEAVVV